jgi:enamine deaminase RidA (YjgF/YER057c/UK114 family)
VPLVHRETNPLTNRSNAAINRQGWMWMAGVQGEGDTSEEAMVVAMDKLQEMLQTNGYSTSDLNYVTMYIKNMGEYGRLNEIYHQVIRHDGPPTRVCVELPLPDCCHVILEAVAFKSIYGEGFL